MNWQGRPTTLSLGLFPAAVGLVFFAASLTPSLIPRDWIFQGILAGLVMALGYMFGRFGLLLWRAIELPEFRGRAARIANSVVLVPALALAGFCLGNVTQWQNLVRTHVGMEPVERGTLLGIVFLGLLTFLLLFLVGAGFQRVFDMLRFRLYRVMAPRAASTLGLVLVLAVTFLVSRDWVLPKLLDFLDNSYETAQELFARAPPRPAGPEKAGSAASLISWEAMGQPGRDFVTGAPTAQAIAAHTGRAAKQPIRVYVGRAQDDSAKQRAGLALAELQRLGAFDRKILLVASPTGTGWLDPGAHDTIEFMHDGDVATVAVQYSYLQSPLALIFETRTGLDQATATMRAIYQHWRTLPPDRRPKFYVHGLSLGAWSSMYSFNIFEMINDPIDGALWAGPPFPSAAWNTAVAARNAGTPYVLPRVGEGELVRFSSQFTNAGLDETPWGRIRILFLQHASDAIVFFEANAFWRAPQWMREKPAPDVSPALRFVPVVTQLQLGLDMLLATRVPQGYGHNYSARSYIDAWAAVTGPQPWDAGAADRLKRFCERDGTPGCSSPRRIGK